MMDAIVVGGGIVGASVAYHLARDGVDTLLLDRGDEGRATDAAAGVVSPATSSQNADPTWYDFALEAFAYYDDLVPALESAQDGPTGYAASGLLGVAVDEDELEEFEATKRRTEERTGASGDAYLAPGTAGEISPSGAVERFPPLAEPLRALLFEDAACIDGGAFADAQIRAGEANGLRTEQAGVDRLTVSDGRVTGVVTDDGSEYDADAVVIAGGAWSTAFSEQLGVSIPVEPVRGQVVQVTPTAGDPAEWPIVVSFRDKVIAPWPDGRVAIGATREEGQGFTPRLTPAGVRTVIDEIERVAPGLDEADLTDLRTGLRPVCVDGLPVLGGVPEVEGAFLATGHGATGITHGPYSGKLVAEAVQGHESQYDLSDFNVARFD